MKATAYAAEIARKRGITAIHIKVRAPGDPGPKTLGPGRHKGVGQNAGVAIWLVRRRHEKAL